MFSEEELAPKCSQVPDLQHQWTRAAGYTAVHGAERFSTLVFLSPFAGVN